ncbi:AfsR/SARP family transcriptional regulator [Polymorphospora sp. NPDC050346]|uniref:AfsR/SARP family transcriptional regulator n=1 Tax=Polymorphospora sp. NPDC050346 TaxID=3155780 RepID=UPI0033DF770D
MPQQDSNIPCQDWTLRANGYAPYDTPVNGAPLRYHVLGPVEAYHAGRWTSPRQAKCRSVLAVLLVNANQVVPAAVLRQQLWPLKAPQTAAKLLQNYIYQVRRALGDPHGRQICTRPSGYLLTAGRDDLDSDRFTALATAGHRALAEGRVESAAGDLRRALGLWRGPAFADIEGVPAVTAEASRLEECRLSAIDAWIEAELALGQHNWLVPAIETLVTAHPLRERLRAHLMLALYRTGRRADALAVFHDLRRTLVDALGLEPGTEAQQMHTAILRDDPTVRVPAPGAVRG